MKTPGSLARPNAGRSGAISLTRLSDRLSFLYLDLCRVEQDDNGTHARVESGDGVVHTTYIPAADLSCLMLGPGTSISAPAAAALARNGCAVLMTGAGGVRMYSAWSPLSRSTTLLQAQARASVMPEVRSVVAARMLRMRFPDLTVPEVNRDGTPISLEQLRGFEGARMKAIYREQARRYRMKSWRRRFDESDGEGPLDPVNDALNHANTALYGVCLAVVCGLGMSPGLGVVHHGSPRAFVLDIADLYKAEISVPLAFKQLNSANPGRDVMRALRDEFRLLRLLPRIVDDLHRVLDVDLPDEEAHPDWDVDVLSLWGSSGEIVLAGHNRHGRDEPLR
ncbi:type I-E CRISPR-associated endonuclease Cas1e [Nocardioides yefusunii]|uniref:CRISPR-associated endonuclease Cas1 n=1 Tax=Nocardioides yefusunii TaxID=2500546 RepID=A0ABW1R241_9ACTN|nr:type I-E CRISPR-associated endonuclease Cas1e [Nocardioides yefusunii]